MVFNKEARQSWIQYGQVLSATKNITIETGQGISTLIQAVKVLTPNQQALILSTKGLTETQIKYALIQNGVAEAEIKNALASVANKKSREELTVAMAQNILMSQGLTEAKAKEILVDAGIDVSDKRELVNKLKLNKQLLINKLAQEGYTAAEIKGITAALGLSTTTNTLTASIRGLGAAIKANPLGIILMALSLVTMGVQKFIQAQEESLQKAKDAAHAYEQEKDSLENLRQEYLNIVDSKDTEAKKNERLIEWKKKLVKAYKDEKDAIIGVTTARETGSAVIDKEQYYNALDLLKKNKKEYEKAQKSLETNLFSYTASSSMYTSLEEKYKDKLKEFGINISSFHSGSIANANYTSTIKIDFDTKSAEEAKRKVLDALNWLDEQENGGDGRLRIPLEKAYEGISENIEKYSTVYNEQISAYAQKYFYEFIQTAEGALSQVADSESFQKWKDKILEMAKDSEPLKNALEELADERFPEYAKAVDDSTSSQSKNILSVKKLTDAYEDLSEVLDDLLSKQDKLADLYEKIAKGTELSASEAYKLIDEFPELTNYLVRVGSKWSFDIKGVNSAFDKLEDDFAQKAQETIDNNKKVIEQSFEDYYAENTKLSFDGFMKEKGINSISINSASDYEKFKNLQEEFNEQVLEERNKLLEAYEKRQEAANDALKNAIALQQLLNNQINDFDFDVDNYNDKIKELMDASEKMAEGEALSYDELTSLIDKFPDLAYIGENGEYFIEKSALDELIEKSYEERNARIDDEIAKTYAVNEEVANRVKAYEDEKERIENALEENRKKYDESYDNPDLTEGILERIELTAEQSKLINELNALDKEQYEADKALMESQSKYSEAYRKYLEALKENLTSGSKSNSISKELQNEIDYYDTIIKAIEAVTDKEIEALEDKKDALKKQKDALKDANDEQQRELDLIKARNNLENAKKRKVYVYTEGSGFQQTLDKKSVEEAEEKLRDVELDIQEANIDKEIDKLDEQIDAFEDYKKQFTDMKSDIEDLIAIEKAKNALELDEQGLLNLPPETAKEIQEGLAEAVLKKDKEDNKDNKEYDKFGDVAFDDFLKKLGTPLSSDEVYKKWTESMLSSFSSPPELLRSVAENISNSSEVYNNNSKKEITFAPNINVYGVSNAEEVKHTVRDELTEFFREFRDSVI